MWCTSNTTGAIEDDHCTKLGHKYLLILQLPTTFTSHITATRITKMLKLPALASLPDALSSLVPPDAERKPYPPWFEPVFYLSCTAMFLQNSRLVRVSWYLGVVLPLATQILQYTKGKYIENYIAGLAIPASVVRVLDLALRHEPQREFWKIRKSTSKKENKDKAWPQESLRGLDGRLNCLSPRGPMGEIFRPRTFRQVLIRAMGNCTSTRFLQTIWSHCDSPKKQLYSLQASCRIHRCLPNGWWRHLLPAHSRSSHGPIPNFLGYPLTVSDTNQLFKRLPSIQLAQHAVKPSGNRNDSPGNLWARWLATYIRKLHTQ